MTKTIDCLVKSNIFQNIFFNYNNMVEEYIKDLETIEIEVKTITKNKNATLS